MADKSVVGSLVSLWRYPVKSMMGEELNSTEVTENGLLGERLRTGGCRNGQNYQRQTAAQVGHFIRLPCCAQFAKAGEDYPARWSNRHG